MIATHFLYIETRRVITSCVYVCFLLKKVGWPTRPVKIAASGNTSGFRVNKIVQVYLHEIQIPCLVILPLSLPAMWLCLSEIGCVM